MIWSRSSAEIIERRPAIEFTQWSGYVCMYVYVRMHHTYYTLNFYNFSNFYYILFFHIFLLSFISYFISQKSSLNWMLRVEVGWNRTRDRLLEVKVGDAGIFHFQISSHSVLCLYSLSLLLKFHTVKPGLLNPFFLSLNTEQVKDENYKTLERQC